jgi:hypothetical protein
VTQRSACDSPLGITQAASNVMQTKLLACLAKRARCTAWSTGGMKQGEQIVCAVWCWHLATGEGFSRRSVVRIVST